MSKLQKEYKDWKLRSEKERNSIKQNSIVKA